MRLIAVWGLTVIAACAHITRPPTPESARIEVKLPVSKSQAYDRTVQAFVAEGVNIAAGSAEGGTITSVPLPMGSSMGKSIYRAVIIARGDSATVVLSGGVRNEMFGAMFGTEPNEEPLHIQMKGILHDAWHRLERVAQRLRGETPGPDTH
jgi:hypothetical protein